jgi:leucyl aminopeptidase
MDMGGAAAVLGCCRTVARLGVKRNVVFVLAVAENAIGSRAYKPHAVIRSHAGKTVQISNTDAEGRLVLADALSLVRQRHSPEVIIDMATLTGACMVALGEYAAGLFSNDSKLSQQLAQSGQQVAERLWPMPILPEHVEEITKGVEQADLKSTGAGRNGGSCTASAFLHQFAVEPAQSGGSSKPVRWAHLDIAGPAMYSKSRGFMCAGGTGFGAQTVTQFIVNYTKL